MKGHFLRGFPLMSWTPGREVVGKKKAPKEYI